VPFTYAPVMRERFPDLVTGLLFVDGIGPEADVSDPVERHLAAARARLSAGTESEMPEIRAWRAAFSAMGLKPTQYRCASEAVLRRLRREDLLPRIHPLIDLCNAVSAAFATPIGVFDRDRIEGTLTVRPADGTERYQSFGGETETPNPDEIVFADAAGEVHARRWTNRQARTSAIGKESRQAMIVAEALHPTAAADMAALVETLSAELAATWSRPVRCRVFSATDPGSETVREPEGQR